MNRVLKFRIVYQHEETGRIAFRFIELGEPFPSLGDGWTIIDKDQFTGLKDKHGREVYEGDIVRDDRWDFTPFEVRWGTGQNELLGGQVGWILDDARFGPVPHIVNELTAYGDVNDPHREDYYPGEVIGNIYEHPELLKDEAKL